MHKVSLKIGFVLDDSLDRPDGVQQYTVTVGEWLRSRGHDVHYLVSESTRRDISNIHTLGKNVAVRFNGNVLHMPLPAPKGPIRELLRANPFDILHVQMPFSPLLAGRVIEAAPAETTIVGTFHIVPHSQFVSIASRLLAAWCRPALRRFDQIMSVSTAAQTFAHDVFGVESIVIPNAVSLSRFRSAKPLPSNQPDIQHILFLGRLVPRKGCQLLLKAIRLLAEDPLVPPFHVTICGRGPLAGTLQSYVDRHDLRAYVSFVGFVSETEKPRYYASADIAVFPSTGGESFGIVLVEAMASGKAAVLAGDNSGYRCVMEECPGDTLFDPFDARNLADRLRALMVDDRERRHIAEGQKHHANQFDIGRVGEQIERVYVSALKRWREVH